MQAKLKKSYRWNSITLFSGMEFVKNEYRSIPEELEEQARNSEYLETKSDKVNEPVKEKKEEKIILESESIAVKPEQAKKNIPKKERR